MKKIVFVQNEILHYRKSFYNKLSESLNVVVIHSGDKTVTANDSYREVLVKVQKLGPFYIQSGIARIIRKLDPAYVIGMFDIRWISTLMLLSKKINFKFIWWGLDTGYSDLATKIKVLIARIGHPIIFYNEFTRKKMQDMDLGNSKLYVSNNTFDVGERVRSYEYFHKKSILFVGSFDFRKRNDLLIKAFKEIINNIPPEIVLNFVGDGDEKSHIESLVKENNLSDRVIFSGRINEPEALKKCYQEAIFSVSYGQAGLSVLQSLGFGVPYVTSENAISGGEISNIKHGENGFFCSDLQSLKRVMISLASDIDLARELGKNAFEYYSLNCSVENMVDGFLDATK